MKKHSSEKQREGGFREIDLLAVLAALGCSLLAYFARYTINPDGVSYLDLGEALRHGNLSAFIQGYWSPLYPALIALASMISGTSGPSLLPVVHFLNAVTVVAVIAMIWYWARPMSTPYFGRAALAAFLLSSARPPRVEAVTPDLLLLAFGVWSAYELLNRRASRPVLLGISLGMMFLSKTSNWPWLFVAFVAIWWGLDKASRLKSFALMFVSCVTIVLLWVVPLSLKSGSPTLGSAGRLNYCWYLASCDSQTPDTHAGVHKNYQTIKLSDGRVFEVARFNTNVPWTYQPWGDPTAWAAGVSTMNRSTPRAIALLKYWWELAYNVVGLWMMFIIAGVLLPLGLISRRQGMFAELRSENRLPAAEMLLGIAGIAEFAAVHAEPRLIAPYVLLFAVGAIQWLLNGSATTTPSRMQVASGRKMWQVCSLVGPLLAVGMLIVRLEEGAMSDSRVKYGIDMMEQAKASIGAEGSRLVVVGPAMPIVANAYLLNWHIVAQVRPASVAAIVTLPPDQMATTLDDLFAGSADAAWITLPDGQFQFAKIRSR